MLRLISFLFALMVISLITLPIAGIFFAIQNEPLVAESVSLTHKDIARAKKLLKENDPRQIQANNVASLVLTEEELNLMLSYSIEQILKGGAQLDLQDGGALLDMTFLLPKNPIGAYANVSLGLAQVAGGVTPSSLKVGSLAVPDFLLNFSVSFLQKFLEKDTTYTAILSSINGLRLSETEAMVLYQWHPDIVSNIKNKGASMLVSAEEKERLLAYAQKIAEVTQATFSKKIPATQLIEPVFALAKSRSISGSAVQENKSALTVLFLYMNGVGVGRLLDAGQRQAYEMKSLQLTLQGRKDFAQHFLISAGLAAGGGGRLSDAIGLFKEVDDSQGGTGFSFNDLAMDWAGTRLAKSATASEEKARYVQNIMGSGLNEGYFVPLADDLPEFLQEADFIRQYGGIGAPKYNSLAKTITERIDALKIHQ